MRWALADELRFSACQRLEARSASFVLRSGRRIVVKLVIARSDMLKSHRIFRWRRIAQITCRRAPFWEVPRSNTD